MSDINGSIPLDSDGHPLPPLNISKTPAPEAESSPIPEAPDA